MGLGKDELLKAVSELDLEKVRGLLNAFEAARKNQEKPQCSKEIRQDAEEFYEAIKQAVHGFYELSRNKLVPNKQVNMALYLKIQEMLFKSLFESDLFISSVKFKKSISELLEDYIREAIDFNFQINNFACKKELVALIEFLLRQEHYQFLRPDTPKLVRQWIGGQSQPELDLAIADGQWEVVRDYGKFALDVARRSVINHLRYYPDDPVLAEKMKKLLASNDEESYEWIKQVLLDFSIKSRCLVSVDLSKLVEVLNTVCGKQESDKNLQHKNIKIFLEDFLNCKFSSVLSYQQCQAFYQMTRQAGFSVGCDVDAELLIHEDRLSFCHPFYRRLLVLAKHSGQLAVTHALIDFLFPEESIKSVAKAESWIEEWLALVISETMLRKKLFEYPILQVAPSYWDIKGFADYFVANDEKVEVLKILNVSETVWTDSGWQSFLAGLERLTCLEKLYMNNCGLTDQRVIDLHRVLKTHPKLIHLDLSNNPEIKQDGGWLLVRWQSENRILRRIALYGCVGMGALALWKVIQSRDIQWQVSAIERDVAGQDVSPLLSVPYSDEINNYLWKLTSNHSQYEVECLSLESNDIYTFEEQVEEITRRANYKQSPVIFIMSEPDIQDHLVCGVVSNNRVLFINPLGFNNRKSERKLIELQRLNKIGSIYFANNRIESPEYADLSGVICLEFVMHVLKNITKQALESFFTAWEQRHQNKFAVLDIAELLPKTLLDLQEFCREAIKTDDYGWQVDALRQAHYQHLQLESQKLNAMVAVPVEKEGAKKQAKDKEKLSDEAPLSSSSSSGVNEQIAQLKVENERLREEMKRKDKKFKQQMAIQEEKMKKFELFMLQNSNPGSMAQPQQQQALAVNTDSAPEVASVAVQAIAVAPTISDIVMVPQVVSQAGLVGQCGIFQVPHDQFSGTESASSSSSIESGQPVVQVSSSSVGKKNQRERLRNEDICKAALGKYISAGLVLGKAKGQGDCFFDALAQGLNKISGVNNVHHKVETLRMHCFEFYQENTELVDKWNLGRDIEFYSLVQHPASQYEKGKLSGNPIWGRLAVEGVILCRRLNLEAICLIEILENPEDKQLVVSFQLATAAKCISIDEEDVQRMGILENFNIPLIVTAAGSYHFVPFLRKNYNSERLVAETEPFSAVKLTR